MTKPELLARIYRLILSWPKPKDADRNESGHSDSCDRQGEDGRFKPAIDLIILDEAGGDR